MLLSQGSFSHITLVCFSATGCTQHPLLQLSEFAAVLTAQGVLFRCPVPQLAPNLPPSLFAVVDAMLFVFP